MPVTIAHISDLHAGDCLEEELKKGIRAVNKLNPDVVIVSGDITDEGQVEEYDQIQAYLDLINAPQFIIPGNHDAKKMGRRIYRQRFGTPGVYRLSLDFADMVLVGCDSTIPDIGDGYLDEAQLQHLQDIIHREPSVNFICPVVHHHVVSTPLTGREKSLLFNAGEVLEILIDSGASIYFCGHRHVPNVMNIENIVISNAGTLSKDKTRNWLPRCFNLIEIDGNMFTFSLYIHSQDRKVTLGTFRAKKHIRNGEAEYILRRKTRKSMRELFPVPTRQPVEVSF